MLRLSSRGIERLLQEWLETDPHPDLGARESFSKKVTFKLRLEGGAGRAGQVTGLCGQGPGLGDYLGSLG